MGSLFTRPIPRLGAFGLIAAAAALSTGAAVAAYPDKPVRVVVPFTPGGGTDFIGRLLSTRLAEMNGWTMVPTNRPGAGTALGLVGAIAGRVAQRGVAIINVLGLLFITPVVTFYLLRDWEKVLAAIDSTPMPYLPAMVMPEGEMLLAVTIGMSSWKGRICSPASCSVNQSLSWVKRSPRIRRMMAPSASSCRSRWVMGSMFSIRASLGSAPGPLPNIARPPLRWSNWTMRWATLNGWW